MLTFLGRIYPTQQAPSSYRITESQNGRGWKGPLGVIQSKPPASLGFSHCLSADHQSETGSCSLLQVISLLREKLEAAAGAETDADVATGSGMERTKADELLTMNQTRSEKNSTNFNHQSSSR